MKAARATAKKDIKASLIAGLKETISQFGESSKKLNKDIERASKQLAKKISKEIRIYKTPASEEIPETPVVEAIVATPEPAVTKKVKATLVKEEA